MPDERQRKKRRSFEQLLDEVSARWHDERRHQVIGDIAEELEEHPNRVLDAIDASIIMGMDDPGTYASLSKIR